MEVFDVSTLNLTRSPNTDLSRQWEAASTPFLMSTLYIGVPNMFLYQRMRWGESPGVGGFRSHGTLTGKPTTPLTLPGTVTRDAALVTRSAENMWSVCTLFSESLYLRNRRLNARQT